MEEIWRYGGDIKSNRRQSTDLEQDEDEGEGCIRNGIRPLNTLEDAHTTHEACDLEKAEEAEEAEGAHRGQAVSHLEARSTREHTRERQGEAEAPVRVRSA